MGKATKATHPVVVFGFSNERRMMHGDTRIYPSFSSSSSHLAAAPPSFLFLPGIGNSTFHRAYNISTQPSKNNNDNNNNKSNKKKGGLEELFLLRCIPSAETRRTTPSTMLTRHPWGFNRNTICLLSYA